MPIETSRWREHEGELRRLPKALDDFRDCLRSLINPTLSPSPLARRDFQTGVIWLPFPAGGERAGG